MKPVSPYQGADATGRLAFIPDWIEGECLYGWSSRYHQGFGLRGKATGTLLFGREHAARVHDLPVGLTRFDHVTGGLLGRPADILRSRTVLGAYLPFMSAAQRELVVDGSDDLQPATLCQLLGIKATGLLRLHPLRYCPECVRDRGRGYQPSTWLLKEQLPCSWLCEKHLRPFVHVRAGRTIWAVPGMVGDELAPPRGHQELSALRLAGRLAHRLLQLKDVSLENLQLCALDRLRVLGVATSDSRLNAQRANKWFASSAIGQWLGRNASVLGYPKGPWINDLLRARRSPWPAKWLLLWSALWEAIDLDQAEEGFRKACNGGQILGTFPQRTLLTDLDLRPNASWPAEEVCFAFERAADLTEVAALLECSDRAVRNWLRQFPMLEKEWTTRMHRQRRELAVSRMNEFMGQRPDCNRTQLLAGCRADTEWLRSNAPTVLRRLLDRIPSDRDAQMQLF